jgi:hypothetical protein
MYGSHSKVVLMYPKFSSSSFSCDDSPKDIQEAAALLGFDKDKWDNDKEPKECDVYWRKLSADQQAAATKLGYTQQEWDSA